MLPSVRPEPQHPAGAHEMKLSLKLSRFVPTSARVGFRVNYVKGLGFRVEGRVNMNDFRPHVQPTSLLQKGQKSPKSM